MFISNNFTLLIFILFDVLIRIVLIQISHLGKYILSYTLLYIEYIFECVSVEVTNANSFLVERR